MRAIRVGHHRETFVGGDQGVHESFRVLVVDIVVSRAVDDEQIALELVGERDGRSETIALGIVLRARL